MSDQGQQATDEIVADLRSSLLSYDQLTRYNTRISELAAEALQLELAGTPEKISQNIGLFHFLKGKIEAYQDLIDDHNSAAEQMKNT